MPNVPADTIPRKPLSDVDWLRVHYHLLAIRLPIGSAGRSVRGGDAARALVSAISKAAQFGWGLQEGSAAALLAGLHDIGAADPRDSFKSVASDAFRLLSTVTPLVEVIGRGRYRESPRRWPSEIKAAVSAARRPR